MISCAPLIFVWDSIVVSLARLNTLGETRNSPTITWWLNKFWCARNQQAQNTNTQTHTRLWRKIKYKVARKRRTVVRVFFCRNKIFESNENCLKIYVAMFFPQLLSTSNWCVTDRVYITLSQYAWTYFEICLCTDFKLMTFWHSLCRTTAFRFGSASCRCMCVAMAKA